MRPPLVSYVTFNRMGLTMKSLSSILRTTDDFELYIVDSNSKDDTWDYLNKLHDSRIKSRVRLPYNAGPIYAVNLNLSKRDKDQYFISVDSDVVIDTKDWVSRFLRVFEAFDEVGLLGVPRANPYPDYLPPVIPMEKGDLSYLQLKEGKVGGIMDFVPGHCQCLRPELIEILGYWSEECHFGDAEISVRVNNYTPYKAGFIKDIEIDMTQTLPCETCDGRRICRLDKKRTTCFTLRNSRYKNIAFAHLNSQKYFKFFEELSEGKRSVYCGSIHDPESIRKHDYNKQWAEENFNFYIKNAN